MDANNSINNFLTALFQEVSISGIQESNKNQIEIFFTTILDTQNTEVFNHPLFYQLLLLIEREPISSKVLSLLVEEAKLKALRIAFTPICNVPAMECKPEPTAPTCNCPPQQNKPITKTRPAPPPPPRDKSVFDGISNGLLSKIYWENEGKDNV